MYVGTNGELRRSREIAAQAEDADKWREVEPLLKELHDAREHFTLKVQSTFLRFVSAEEAFSKWWKKTQEEATNRKDGSATDTESG